MARLYNITDIRNLYWIDTDDNTYMEHKIKFLSKEWFLYMWRNRIKFKIKVETYT